MIIGLTKQGNRWWMNKGATLTPAEELQVERFKRVDERCAKNMRDMKFNAAWREAVKHECKVDLGDKDFRLDFKGDKNG